MPCCFSCNKIKWRHPLKEWNNWLENLVYGPKNITSINNPMNPAFNNLYKNRFRSAKRKAEKKKIKFEWELDKIFYYKLTNMPCNYCKILPFAINGHKNTGSKILYEYTYNGVDRINNSKYYLLDNVVPACFICNQGKSKMPPEVFLGKIDKIKNFVKHFSFRQSDKDFGPFKYDLPFPTKTRIF